MSNCDVVAFIHSLGFDPNPRIELVDAKRAQEWIDSNPNDRKIRPGVIKKYAKAMIKNEWLLSNDFIVLDEHGRRINGQHRCYAVILADKTIPGIKVPFYVITLPNSYTVNMDNGTKRTNDDVLNYAGKLDFDGLAAFIKFIVHQPNGISDRTLLLKLYDEMEQVINWTSDLFAGKELTVRAELKAAIARAYFAGINQNSLKLFVDVMTMDEDQYASALINWKQNYPQYPIEIIGRIKNYIKKIRAPKTYPECTRHYLILENTINCFVNNYPVSKFDDFIKKSSLTVKDEIFPSSEASRLMELAKSK